MVHRRRVARQVVLQHTDGFESLAQLEGNDLVLQFRAHDGFDIVGGVRVVLGAPCIAGHASTEHDALELEILAEFLADAVEALPDPETSEVRVDADIHAIEHIAFGVVPRRKSAAGDLVPCVRGESDVRADHEGCAVSHGLAFVFGDELAFREAVDMAEKIVARIAHAGSVDPL